MSKGSLFFGNASGKLGQVVLSTLKGQQIARAYQPKVANPKTTLQTDQRAIFANAVKFFKHSQQNLFKFAFEDKKKRESDYNAFMRHNVSVAMLPTRSAYNNPFYPAVGNRWMLSYGSMVEPELSLFNADYGFSFNLGEADRNTYTVGQFSSYLISKYSLAEGDIVTFVAVLANEVHDIEDEGEEPVSWAISQIIVSTSDTSILFNVLNERLTSHKLAFAITGSGSASYIQGLGNQGKSGCGGFSVIFSRKTGNELKVSTSYLYNNNAANSIYQASLQSAYRTAALNSWGRQTEAVLEGSIAKSE